MKIYAKKLHNLDELEREKRKLRKEVKRMDKEPFIAKLKGQTVVEESKDHGGGGSPLSFLTGPTSVIALKLIGRYLGKKRATPVRMYDDDDMPHHAPKKKNLAKAVLFEVVGGYLKWKAVELAYKGVKAIIRKNSAR